MSPVMATVVLAAALAYVALAGLAVRRPLLGRLALREAVRRPLQSALFVLGLLVGAATIQTAQTLADSETAFLTASVHRAWGRVDLTVDARGAFFDPELASRLGDDARLRPHLAGLQAGVELTVAAANLDRRLGKSPVRLVGFDPATQPAFGAYELTDGSRTYGADLGPGGVFVSRALADALEAHVGDRLRVSLGVEGRTAAVDLHVAGISRESGPGAYGAPPLGTRHVLFAPLSSLRAIVGDRVNVLRVTTGAAGGTAVTASRQTEPLVRAAARSLPGGDGLEVRAGKATQVENVLSTQETIRAWWTAMSLLVALIGAFLAVNLALALAEERRPRLAVLRALGLTRGGLVAMSVLEGAVYVLPASVAGAALGALFSAVVILPRTPSGGASLEAASLAFSAAAASLVMLGTLLGVSIRTSRMTIAAATKDLPEPQRGERPSRTRRVLLAALALGSVGALAAEAAELRFLGGAGLIALLAALARGRVPDRVRATLAGLALSAWAFGDAFALAKADRYGGSVFLLTLPTLAIALSATLTANLRLLERLADALAVVMPGLPATLRPPLAYLARRPVRSGLTTAGFALALAIVTLFAAVYGLLRPNYERETMGFDVRVISWSGVPIALPPEIDAQVAQRIVVPTFRYTGDPPSRWSTARAITLGAVADEDFAKLRFALSWRNPRFASDAEAWEAVRTDPRWFIGSDVTGGRGLTLLGRDGPVELKQAGDASRVLLPGVIASRAALAPFAHLPQGSFALLDARPEVEPAALAREVRRALFAEGIDAETSRDLLDAQSASGAAFLDMIALFLATGLVVAVAALGVLALRAVVERRRAIGILRALGYRPGQVLGGLLAEATAVTSAGVLAGTASGALIAYVFANAQGWPFAVDGLRLAIPVAIVVIGSILVALWPAVRAARILPAEAVRLVD